MFVTGLTISTNFPGTTGGAQSANGGGPSDAFVARLNATLTALSQATYLGGNDSDIGLALAIHPTSGDVFVTGDTGSGNFPGTTGGAQPVPGGLFGGDAFVARLTADLAGVAQPTPSNIPTLSPGILALLAAGLASVAVLLMRRNA